MNRDEMIQAMSRLAGMSMVLAFSSESPTVYSYEIDTSSESRGQRSQVIDVMLSDDGQDVIAFSHIGEVPANPAVLQNMLKENVDGCYSRLCIANNRVAQIYRYEISKLEVREFLSALYELASFADIYEEKYFGGDAN